jgi:CheY-like chemotaxis protein
LSGGLRQRHCWQLPASTSTSLYVYFPHPLSSSVRCVRNAPLENVGSNVGKALECIFIKQNVWIEMSATSTSPWGATRKKWPVQAANGPTKGADASAVLRKVLVVDDEAELADLTAILLGARGLNVLTAYSAEEALRLLGSDVEIDAVVSDVVMPGMSGLELGDAVREMYPRVKVVLVSGFAPSDILTSRERPYLFASKPYNMETLLKLLHS